MNFELAKEKAIRYLAMAKKTEYEVICKLKKLDVSDDIINKVIVFLKELGYINDEKYIDAYIRECMRLLKYSIFEIKQKLLQKGINKYIIEENLEKLRQTDYEKKIIEILYKTKLKNLDEIKQKQYLYRRGLKINQFDEI